MSEWWSYSLADFLLFSPQTYLRLFALHNEALWPGQIGAIIGGFALLMALQGDNGRRGALLVAGTAWLLVAWLWFLERYATINWAADWLGAGFALQTLLLWIAALRRGTESGGLARAVGFVLIVFAILAQPLLPMLLGRDWQQGEVFALMPGPTVVATLGLLLVLRASWLLFLLPLLWCILDGAALSTMKLPEAWLLPACGLLAFVMRLPRRSTG